MDLIKTQLIESVFAGGGEMGRFGVSPLNVAQTEPAHSCRTPTTGSLAAGPAETTPLQRTVRMASREAEPKYRAPGEGNNSCSLVFTSFCFGGVK
jgi:hypothetical protein